VQELEGAQTVEVLSPTTSTTSSFDMVSDCDDAKEDCDRDDVDVEKEAQRGYEKDGKSEQGDSGEECPGARAQRSNSEDSVDWASPASPAASTIASARERR
jgi:hypothetical protein